MDMEKKVNKINKILEKEVKNFLGLNYHESDNELLHWQDKVEKVLEVREAWDKIPKKLWPYVRILMEKAVNNALLCEAEKDAGEGF